MVSAGNGNYGLFKSVFSHFEGRLSAVDHLSYRVGANAVYL